MTNGSIAMQLCELDLKHELDPEARRALGRDVAALDDVVAVWLSVEDDGTPEGKERLQIAVNLPRDKSVRLLSRPFGRYRQLYGIRSAIRTYQYDGSFVIPYEMAKALNVPYLKDRPVRVLEVFKEPVGEFPWSPVPYDIAELPPLVKNPPPFIRAVRAE
jgi:hypothetical protein